VVDVASQEIITAATFNGLQSRIETILGQGFTDTGYGQALSSSIVAANTVITASHLVALKADIDKCRAHQTGSLSTLEAVIATDRIGAVEAISASGVSLATKGINDYLALTAIIEGDKLNCDDTQASIETAISSTRTSLWNGTLIHTVSVTFSDAAARRHFFNTGGQLRVTGQLSDGTNAKDADWASLLSAMGTISIGLHATTHTGSGVPTAIGNYELTSSYQRLFHKLGGGGYGDNIFIINGKASADNVIEVEIQYQDNHPSGSGVDPNITGTVVSSIIQRRASGTYVSVPSPTYNNITTLA
jgi:hypothetical protein|tara:strand:+ start:235 stop:1143 length:909 start_codon:yes stop_codon:yes gene_type:complete